MKRADDMAEHTLARHMPPWLPERGEFPILGERRLRDDQIDAIQRWVQQDDRRRVPAIGRRRRRSPTAGSSVRRTPSSRRRAAIRWLPGREDVYRNLVLRTSLKAGVYVRAVEFKTGGAPIHHAVIRIDQTSASRRRDGEDGQPGFEGMAWSNVQDPAGHFIGWAPGRGPIVAPPGMPWRLEKGADLVVEVHVMPPDAALAIQPTVGLFFSSTPPVHMPISVKMGSKLIDIPPGERAYVVTDSYELPVAVDLLSVYPHAHTSARRCSSPRRCPTAP